MRAFLPAYDQVTIYHLRDLVSNRRKIVRCEDVKVLQVPHFEHLSIEDILEFASSHNGGVAMMALPESRKEVTKLPRAYIANVIYSETGEPFLEWMKLRVQARN